MVTENDFTRIDRDYNGNTRYIVGTYSIGQAFNIVDIEFGGVISKISYGDYVAMSKYFCGKKRDTLEYPQHLIFECFNLPDLVDDVNNAVKQILNGTFFPETKYINFKQKGKVYSVHKTEFEGEAEIMRDLYNEPNKGKTFYYVSNKEGQPNYNENN